MDYYQVRDQLLLSEERIQQVTLVRLRILQWQQLCDELIQRDAVALLEHYSRFETSGFESQLATACSILPSNQEFLKELLALPTDAQTLNRTLERWHFDDFLGHRIRSRDQPQFEAWRHEIHGKATIFLNRCNTVEAVLQAHFDSILAASNQDAGATEESDVREL